MLESPEFPPMENSRVYVKKKTKHFHSTVQERNINCNEELKYCCTIQLI